MNPQCSTSFALGSVRACIPQGHFDAEAAAVGTVLIGRGADLRNVVSSTKMYADTQTNTHTHISRTHTPTHPHVYVYLYVYIYIYIYIIHMYIERERERERETHTHYIHVHTHIYIYTCPPSLFACLPIQDTGCHRQGYIEALIYYLYVRIHGREGGSNRQTHTHIHTFGYRQIGR